MRRNVYGLTLCAMLFVLLAFPLYAQQPTKIPRIGFLSGGWAEPLYSARHRRIPAGSARAWLRRGKEHRH